MNGASQQKQHSYSVDRNIINIEPLQGSFLVHLFFHRVSPGAIHIEALRAWGEKKAASNYKYKKAPVKSLTEAKNGLCKSKALCLDLPSIGGAGGGPYFLQKADRHIQFHREITAHVEHTLPSRNLVNGCVL